MRWLVPAALAATAPALAAPAPTRVVWVQVTSPLDCPEPGAVLSMLRARLGEARVQSGEAPGGSLLLRSSPHGRTGVSAVLAQDGVTIVERTIDVEPAECTGLAQTLALVTESWLPAPPAAAAPPPAAVVREPVSPVPGVSAVAVRGPSAPGSPARVGLGLEAAIGPSLPLDVSGSAALLVRVAAELGVEPWRIGARAELETPSRLDSFETVSIYHATAEALIGVDVFQSGPVASSALLTAGADVLFVNAANYSSPLEARLIELEALPGEAIATIVGCPIKTVWTRLYHARRELQELSRGLADRSDP